MKLFVFLMTLILVTSGNVFAQASTEIGAITETRTRDLSTRMWSDKLGKYTVVAKIVDFIDGKVRLEKTDGKIVTVPVNVLCEADRRFLRSLAWADKEEMPLHEALAENLIEVRSEDYAQQKLTIIVNPKGLVVVPKITVPSGTWIELDGHPRSGRIFVQGDVIDPNKRGGRESDPMEGVGHLIAIPGDLVAIVPVIETAQVGPTKYENRNHSSITRAGLDLLAAKILGDVKATDHDDILSTTAGLLMIKTPNLSLDQLQAYATRVFTDRTTLFQQRYVLNKKSRTSELYTWTATSEHLVKGEHLLEKAKFDSSQTDEAAMPPSREVKSDNDKTVSLVDALAQDQVTIAGRKGLGGKLILRLTRTKLAPSGPMQVRIPIGTVLLVDDGRGDEPLRVYPLYDETIDLFGSVEGGVQVPVLNGSYKREIKTTRELGVTAEFDAKIESLFGDRPADHYPQMAIEAVLLDRDDLDRDQIQYHISQVGVPNEQMAMEVTQPLIDTAKRRIAGDETAVATESTASLPNSDRIKSSVSPPADSRSKNSQSQLPVEPKVMSQPLSEDDQRKAALVEKRREYAPESPEQDLVGTWVAVSETEARKFFEPMMVNRLEQAAIAMGKSLSNEERQMVEAQAAMALRSLKVFSGTITFDADGKLEGKLTGPHVGRGGNLTGRWQVLGGGGGFSINLSGIGASFDINQLVYVAEGRLACLGSATVTSYGIIVLKKL